MGESIQGFEADFLKVQGFGKFDLFTYAPIRRPDLSKQAAGQKLWVY